jgi:hypothetical protein
VLAVRRFQFIVKKRNNRFEMLTSFGGEKQFGNHHKTPKKFNRVESSSVGAVGAVGA